MLKLKNILFTESLIGPVYHGSSEDIKEFDFDKAKEFGIHFGTKQSASHRGETKNNKKFFLKKYNLLINKPLHLDDVFGWSLESVLENMLKNNIISFEKYKTDLENLKRKALEISKVTGLSFRNAKNNALKKYLLDLGYDGIVYDNKGEAGGTAYIVFDGSQVKEIN